MVDINTTPHHVTPEFKIIQLDPSIKNNELNSNGCFGFLQRAVRQITGDDSRLNYRLTFKKEYSSEENSQCTSQCTSSKQQKNYVNVSNFNNKENPYIKMSNTATAKDERVKMTNLIREQHLYYNTDNQKLLDSNSVDPIDSEIDAGNGQEDTSKIMLANNLIDPDYNTEEPIYSEIYDGNGQEDLANNSTVSDDYVKITNLIWEKHPYYNTDNQNLLGSNSVDPIDSEIDDGNGQEDTSKIMLANNPIDPDYNTEEPIYSEIDDGNGQEDLANNSTAPDDYVKMTNLIWEKHTDNQNLLDSNSVDSIDSESDDGNGQEDLANNSTVPDDYVKMTNLIWEKHTDNQNLLDSNGQEDTSKIMLANNPINPDYNTEEPIYWEIGDIKLK